MDIQFEKRTHFWGRIWMITALILIISVPLFFCIINNSWPDYKHLIKGLLGVIPIFWTTCTT